MAPKKKTKAKKLSTDEAVQLIYRHMATKEELRELATKGELQDEMGALRSETRQNFDLIRAEMNQFVRIIRTDYDSLAKRVKRLEEKVYRK